MVCILGIVLVLSVCTLLFPALCSSGTAVSPAQQHSQVILSTVRRRLSIIGNLHGFLCMRDLPQPREFAL